MSDPEIPTEGLPGTKTPKQIRVIGDKIKGKTARERLTEFDAEMEEQMAKSEKIMTRRRLGDVTRKVEREEVREEAKE